MTTNSAEALHQHTTDLFDNEIDSANVTYPYKEQILSVADQLVRLVPNESVRLTPWLNATNRSPLTTPTTAALSPHLTNLLSTSRVKWCCLVVVASASFQSAFLLPISVRQRSQSMTDLTK
ncbi:hypothetical protein OK016_28155 [Vibrio chagasii]|nr:hypothetical protein [Vibrio chagasii]